MHLSQNAKIPVVKLGRKDLYCNLQSQHKCSDCRVFTLPVDAVQATAILINPNPPKGYTGGVKKMH